MLFWVIMASRHQNIFLRSSWSVLKRLWKMKKKTASWKYLRGKITRHDPTCAIKSMIPDVVHYFELQIYLELWYFGRLAYTLSWRICTEKDDTKRGESWKICRHMANGNLDTPDRFFFLQFCSFETRTWPHKPDRPSRNWGVSKPDRTFHIFRASRSGDSRI